LLYNPILKNLGDRLGEEVREMGRGDGEVEEMRKGLLECRTTDRDPAMSIILTPEQEQFIQTKLLTGKYRTAEEVLEMALRLLDEYDQADTNWLNRVREKVDAAIAASDQTPPIDGETFVNQILDRFQQLKQAQE
jgi:antitoxin ParD1/3/4